MLVLGRLDGRGPSSAELFGRRVRDLDDVGPKRPDLGVVLERVELAENAVALVDEVGEQLGTVASHEPLVTTGPIAKRPACQPTLG